MKSKFIIVVLTLICSVYLCNAQTTNVNVMVNNSSNGNYVNDYTINGVPKSQDIGGVDIDVESQTIEFGFLNGGFAYNAPLPIVTGVRLNNYNSKPVTVILQLLYKTNLGLKPYPRFYDEGEKITTIVLDARGEKNSTKFISFPSNGRSYITEVISADMIVRQLK